jgi:hypothetical protein
VAAIATHLQQGDRIRMSGLGVLEVKSRAARTGRNPATGEAIQIKARKKVGFRPVKELKAGLRSASVDRCARSDPTLTYVYHCSACQRRTGSVMHAGASFLKGQVRIDGQPKFLSA